jgi:hypothetical protein
MQDAEAPRRIIRRGAFAFAVVVIEKFYCTCLQTIYPIRPGD